MTTVKDVLKSFLKLAEEGHGDLPVLYRHGASGDCGEIGTPHVTDHQNECGPFFEDMGYPADTKSYVSLYVGN